MYKIAVAGNPNCGKTCIFNNLTGSAQRVGNYPGVTVEFVSGETKFSDEKVAVVDLPGTYSLTAYSQEEIVARNYIVDTNPDVIINVVDASNLERNLYLTVQLLELNVPLVIALNMVDVAAKKGLVIDEHRLSELLGVKVVRTIGSRKIGIPELKNACLETIGKKLLPRPVNYTHELNNILPPLVDAVEGNTELCRSFPARWIALRLLEDDDVVLRRLEDNADAERIKAELKRAKKRIYDHSFEESSTAVVEARYGVANGASRDVTTMSEEAKQMYTDIIDRIVCNRFFGVVILCVIVLSLFTSVFKLADEWQWIPLFNGQWTSPTGLLNLFFEQMGEVVTNYVQTPWLESMLNDGIISGVGGVLSFVPLIFFMFLFISILEDSGYVARVAFILDRVLKTFGLQGKSILALIVSGGLGAGGCAVPGVLATRTLREEKDRLITILVAPFMNCGAKLPVYAMLIAAFFSNARGAMLFLIWLLSWCFALVAAYCLRRWVIKGDQTPFVMELPVYHLPTFRGVLMDTWHRTCLYIKKAGTVILAISIILWALMYFPRHSYDPYENRMNQSRKAFVKRLDNDTFADIFNDDNFEETEKFMVRAVKSGKISEVKGNGKLNRQRISFAEQLLTYYEKVRNETPGKGPGSSALGDIPMAIPAFLRYEGTIIAIKNEYSKDQLRRSFAGKTGESLVPLSHFAGFDWRDNIALIGGFGAKEVVLGTLGTAYAMGEEDPFQPVTLSERLREDPEWNGLRAFVLMLFVMAYAPCFVTIAAIKKETGLWRWAVFSTIYSTVSAFIVCIIVYQIGSLFLN